MARSKIAKCAAFAILAALLGEPISARTHHRSIRSRSFLQAGTQWGRDYHCMEQKANADEPVHFEEGWQVSDVFKMVGEFDESNEVSFTASSQDDEMKVRISREDKKIYLDDKGIEDLKGDGKYVMVLLKKIGGKKYHMYVYTQTDFEEPFETSEVTFEVPHAFDENRRWDLHAHTGKLIENNCPLSTTAGNIKKTEVAGEYSDWSEWTDCLNHGEEPVTETTRTRELIKAPIGLEAEPLEEKKECPDIDAIFSDWDHWSDCINVGSEFKTVTKRTRTLVTPPSGNGSAAGETEEEKDCPLTVDGCVHAYKRKGTQVFEKTAKNFNNCQIDCRKVDDCFFTVWHSTEAICTGYKYPGDIVEDGDSESSPFITTFTSCPDPNQAIGYKSVAYNTGLYYSCPAGYKVNIVRGLAGLSSWMKADKAGYTNKEVIFSTKKVREAVDEQSKERQLDQPIDLNFRCRTENFNMDTLAPADEPKGCETLSSCTPA